eukprot:1170177-Heterocapsa_arctica.AAC.1
MSTATSTAPLVQRRVLDGPTGAVCGTWLLTAGAWLKTTPYMNKPSSGSGYSGPKPSPSIPFWLT